VTDEIRPQGSVRPRGRKKIPWRKDRALLTQIADVDRRRLRGESIPSIALVVGVSETTVKEHVRRATALFRERTADAVEEDRAEKIRVLEEIIRCALGQARFDYEAAKAVLFGTVAHDMDGAELEVRLPEIPPDFQGVIKMPDFRGQPAAALNVARQALMDVAKLRGLVVEKVAPTDAAGNTLDLASLVQLARRGAA
jgi:hypothetical protein